ncbi:K02A2.6-like [Cordylochernes scorpioides]|uniref:K02A2.6-like n=1 Tax=Cordylochernes scorpioides TaxID=51811 RepID=A0ABY6K3T2_9ARAC|nr:K02A2.6-like [Cordylochernes scorpioides]
MENQARSDATSEGNTTPSIVTDIVAQLAAALRDIVNPGQRDSDLPRYDGTYPAANFFQQYDDIAGRAYLTETKRLQKLPAQLSGEPLTFFRQLDLANKSYDQARQILIDLYPGTVEVSFSKFLALKLTPQTTLQGYYKEKTAMGLQLNLPTDIILESLTEGLPTADQRLVRTVSPNTLKDWHDLMARIKGLSVPAPARPTPEPTSSRHDGHITLAREQPSRPYNMPPRFFSTPRLPRHADSSVPSRPPSPCHYCRGNHWNAQCPRRQPSGRSNAFYQETTGRQPRTSPSTARSQPARSTPPSDTTVQTTPRSEEIGDSKLPFGILSLNILSNFKLKIDLCNFLVFQNEAPLPPTMYHFSLVNDSCNYGKSLENSSKMANLATYQHNPSMHVSDTSRHGLSYMSPSHETISNCDFASPKKPVDMPQNNVFNDCIPNYTTNVCQIPASQSCSNSNIPLSFLDIINRYSHIFSSNKFDVPKLKIPPVKIHTLSDKIIALRPYRASLVDQREIQEQVNQMLKFGIIEPSFSPYASPVTLVTKKDKTKRFCVDFRKLNEIICPDVHPLPLIETVLDKLAHAKIFTNVDINSAFWQVEIEPSSRNLLAFVTLEGQYQFSRLPFGLRNSPQIYERALSQVIQKYELDFIAHYFDDFVIFSNTIEEHAQHIQKFFLVCQEENIKLNYNKCEFLKTQIEFLGYTIKSGTYTPQIKNLDVINAIKVPTNLKTLQSFLGAINVYNKFIPNYAQLRTPLNKLLKKDTTWNWDNQCQTSFEALKENLGVRSVEAELVGIRSKGLLSASRCPWIETART